MTTDDRLVGAKSAKAIELIAETIWRSEYRRATGRLRSVKWPDGISEVDAERYRYLARDVFSALEFTGALSTGANR